MSYVSFGHGGSATQWHLPGTATNLLPAPITGQAPVPNALTSGALTPAWDATLFGGLVGYTGAGGRQVFDVVNGWNSVKNAFLQLDVGGKYGFDGFVQVDVNASAVTESVDLLLQGVKRGNTVTGAGDDRVEIQMLSNESTWNNEFRVSTGAGGDVVVLKGLDRDAQLLSADATYEAMTGGAWGGVWNTSGSYTKTFVDLGAGNDKLIGHGSADDARGGAGDDILDGGAGDDTLAGGTGDDVLNGGAGADRFAFGTGLGDDVVLDFSLAGGDVVALLGFGGALDSFDEAMAAAAQVGTDTLITVQGEGTILLRGVVKEQLTANDFVFA